MTNLTYKTIMGLKWASTFCACAKFVMKTDDDMFVNVPNILDAVKDNALALQTSVGGACYLAVNPIRDVNSNGLPRSEVIRIKHIRVTAQARGT